MEWFRVYNSIKDDPKILGLTPENRWFYVALLAVSSEQKERGSLPNSDDLALSLRVRRTKLDGIIAALKGRGLIDQDLTTKRLTLHGWSKRQRRTDDVAARVSKHRETHQKRYTSAACNVTETLPHARATDTDTELDNPPTPLAGGARAGKEAPPRMPNPPSDPEYKSVLAKVPEGWGPQGLDAASRLLAEHSAAAVRYGLDDVLERFEGRFDLRVARYWRSVAEANPDGRPLPRASPRQAPPPPKPPTFFRAEPDEVLPLPSQTRGNPHADERSVRNGRLERAGRATAPPEP